MQPTHTSSAKRMAIAAGAILFACAIVPMPALSQNRSSFIDIPYGAGIYASTTFGTLFGFRGTNVFRRIGITRSGGSDGTIGLVANLINLSGLRYTDIDVVDSATAGIQFISLNNRSISNTFFEWITIVNPGRSGVGYGIVERSGAVGSATISYTSVVNPRTRGWQDNAPAFNLVRGPGNSGW